MRTIGILGIVVLLAASLSWAGTNGSVNPFLRSSEEGMGKAGAFVEVRVGASGFSGVQAVHVDVEYDPAGLAFEGFESGNLFNDPLVLGPFDRTDRHVVDVTTATLDGAVSRASGDVGVFRFRVLDPDRSEVRIVSFQTADGEWAVDEQVSYGNAVGVATLPSSTRLVGAAPNPFNPVTSISFELSARAEVSLEVYNVSGQRVKTLASGSWDAGRHSVTWNGTDQSGRGVSSGVYFTLFRSGGKTESKRVTLLR